MGRDRGQRRDPARLRFCIAWFSACLSGWQRPTVGEPVCGWPNPCTDPARHPPVCLVVAIPYCPSAATSKGKAASIATMIASGTTVREPAFEDAARSRYRTRFGRVLRHLVDRAQRPGDHHRGLCRASRATGRAIVEDARGCPHRSGRPQRRARRIRARLGSRPDQLRPEGATGPDRRAVQPGRRRCPPAQRRRAEAPVATDPQNPFSSASSASTARWAKSWLRKLRESSSTRSVEPSSRMTSNAWRASDSLVNLTSTTSR